jgi:hypothetical protein
MSFMLLGINVRLLLKKCSSGRDDNADLLLCLHTYATEVMLRDRVECYFFSGGGGGGGA